MNPREHDPLRLDVEALAGAGGRLQGRWPLRELGRIVEVAHAQAQPGEGDAVEWRVHGERRAARGTPGEIWLHLQAVAPLRLTCQRCLEPVAHELRVARSFRLVAGEDAAAALDAEIEDDVLELTRALDLRELVEDELLLALPLVPRHDSCPQPLVAPAAREAQPPAADHPFAALESLKHLRRTVN